MEQTWQLPNKDQESQYLPMYNLYIYRIIYCSPPNYDVQISAPPMAPR